MGVPEWAVGLFGGRAEEIGRRLVRALTDAHQRGLMAQEGAHLKTKHAYGGAWTAKYELVVEALRELPGAEVFHPHGAHFDLVRLDGAVLLPFRHATTLSVPIGEAKVTTKVPRRLGEEFQPRLPELTLFDVERAEEPEDAAEDGDGGAGELIDVDTPVVYVGFVCNAGSDRLLGAWWGLAPHRDAEGKLWWTPSALPLSAPTPLTLAGATGPGFDQGELPLVPVKSKVDPVDARRR
ncbi:hypothetical protein [Actinosynnema sp. NPDC020468]|uniref:hypothetical protein n=1 Tax=Actinosynnema sp. NPDC020468 TaxID=3154488 RepID=UPI0033D7E77C